MSTNPHLPLKPVGTPSMKKHLKDVEVSGSDNDAHDLTSSKIKSPTIPVVKPPLPPKPAKTPSMKKYFKDIDVSGSGMDVYDKTSSILKSPTSPTVKPPLPPKPVRTPSMKKHLKVSGSGRVAHVISGDEEDDVDSFSSEDDGDNYIERIGRSLSSLNVPHIPRQRSSSASRSRRRRATLSDSYTTDSHTDEDSSYSSRTISPLTSATSFFNTISSPLSMPTLFYRKTKMISLVPEGAVDPNNLVPAAAMMDLDNSNQAPISPTTQLNDHIPEIPAPPLITQHTRLKQKIKTLETKISEYRDQEIEDPLSEFTTEEIKETIDKYVTTVAGLKRSITLYREIIYKVASDPDILEFAPHMIAYQLTLIDSAIFLEIDPHSLLAHSTKNPDPKIIASTDFFNYLTRIVECSILSPVEASSRALVIHHWVKVAAKLHELHNFQTLKAILSALGTPPIKRLKRTWTCIPKKSMVKLDSLNEMMSESSNYEKYRETIQPEIFSRKPIVPFLGTFIMDATYLSAAIRNSASSSINSPLISLSMTSTTTNSDDSDSGNGNKNNNITGNSCFTHPISRSMSLPSSPEKILTLQDDSRVQELLHTMFRYQNGPKYQPIPPMSYIKASTKHHFRATSLGAALHRGSVIRYHNRNDDDNEIIKEKQQIITHYLLTRTWIPEKSVDELSLQREPHKQKSSQDATV
ncbi:6391_t:CDS:2 [Entrophospora sp. SA101]|nr:6391_t:CDS:2 [Entrophospora sp. SA101]